MTLKKALLLTLVASQITCVAGVSAGKRNHDAINPLTFGANNTLKRFLPKLDRNRACYPYTAVDKDGNYSGGLQDSGSESGKCSSSDKQQVYTRTARVNSNTHAVMYAYYFPKDNGRDIPSLGHRHDWEHVFVFVQDLGNISREKVVGAAYSGHGDVIATSNPNRDGKQIYIDYDYHGLITGFTHSFEEGNSGTNDNHVLISYNKLPQAAKDTLDNQSFGSAIVPFRNSGNRWTSRVEQAKDALGY